jgi:hypothetical protein
MTDFTKLTAHQISGLLQQAKDDVESKRTEMKVLIGSRYQDIIEAADRCAGMNQDAKKIQQLVKDIPEHCGRLRESTSKSSPDAESGDEVVGRRIKCILDASEKIWKYLGQSEFLSAAIVYVKASEAFALLSSHAVLQRFPFLHQQWASLKYMSQTILQSAADFLECLDETTGDESVAGALYVHVALGDSTYAQAIDIFLASRERWMQVLMDKEKLSATTVGQRLLQSIKTLKSTVFQSATIFTKPVKGEALIETYAQKWKTITADYTCNLCQRSSSSNTSFSNELVQRRFKVWFANQQKQVDDNCPSLMSDFVDMEELAQTQQHIIDVNDGLVGDAAEGQAWDAACKSVLKKSAGVDLWEEFFQPLFVAQVDKLLQVSLHSSFRQIQGQLLDSECTSAPSQIVSELQQSLHALLTSCSKLDGKSAEVQRQILQRHCCVVAVLLMTDIQKRKESLEEEVEKSSSDGAESFDGGRPSELLLFLGQLCWAMAKRCPALFEIVPDTGDDLTDLVTDDEISAAQKAVEDLTNPEDKATTKEIVRAAKVRGCGYTACLPFLTQNQNEHKMFCSFVALQKALRAAGKVKGATTTSDLQNKFQDLSHSSLEAWAGWIANVVGKSITQHLFEAEDWKQSDSSWRQQHASWEQVTIAEDAEDGESLEETVWLPSSASAPVMVMLFSLAIQLQHVCAAQQKAVATAEESDSLVDLQILAQLLRKATHSVVVQIYTKLCIESSETSKCAEAAVLQVRRGGGTQHSLSLRSRCAHSCLARVVVVFC